MLIACAAILLLGCGETCPDAYVEGETCPRDKFAEWEVELAGVDGAGITVCRLDPSCNWPSVAVICANDRCVTDARTEWAVNSEVDCDAGRGIDLAPGESLRFNISVSSLWPEHLRCAIAIDATPAWRAGATGSEDVAWRWNGEATQTLYDPQYRESIR